MSYQVVVVIPSVANLCQALQSAYDNGAAGSFKLVSAEGEVTVTFERELRDDREFLERRIQQGLSVAKAVCDQLADELRLAEDRSVLCWLVEKLRAGSARIQGIPAGFAAEAYTNTVQPLTWRAQGDANDYCLLRDGNWLAALKMNGELHVAEQERYVAQLAAAPELAAALRATIVPLMRLGDFVGNVDEGGASGLGSFDRCAILLQARQALAKLGLDI